MRFVVIFLSIFQFIAINANIPSVYKSYENYSRLSNKQRPSPVIEEEKEEPQARIIQSKPQLAPITSAPIRAPLKTPSSNTMAVKQLGNTPIATGNLNQNNPSKQSGVGSILSDM